MLTSKLSVLRPGLPAVHPTVPSTVATSMGQALELLLKKITVPTATKSGSNSDNRITETFKTGWELQFN